MQDLSQRELEKLNITEKGLYVRLHKIGKNEPFSPEDFKEFTYDLIVYSSSKLTDKAKYGNNDEKLENYEKLISELRKREQHYLKIVKESERRQLFHLTERNKAETEIFKANEKIILLQESIKIKNEKIRKYVKFNRISNKSAILFLISQIILLYFAVFF